MLCRNAQTNPGPCRNNTGRPYSDNHRTSKNIFFDRCMSLNARSLCNKLNEFHDLVKMKNVDVVAVTETWLHQRILDKEILDLNYIIFRRDRPQLQRGGGVMICVKSDFISVRRLDLENETVEAVVCELSGINNSRLIIAAFYRTPNMDFDSLHDLVNVFHNINRTGVNKNFFISYLLRFSHRIYPMKNTYGNFFIHHNRETTGSHVGKVFHPIRKQLSK